MRLWSLHPGYLDPTGLVSVWREALLAQAVLAGKTKGYQHHPQLIRFSSQKNPLQFLGAYLSCVWAEAKKRDYAFDDSKILHFSLDPLSRIPVTQEQMIFERKHLLSKLKTRNPTLFKVHKKIPSFKPHPLFYLIPGSIEPWEKGV